MSIQGSINSVVGTVAVISKLGKKTIAPNQANSNMIQRREIANQQITAYKGKYYNQDGKVIPRFPKVDAMGNLVKEN